MHTFRVVDIRFVGGSRLDFVGIKFIKGENVEVGCESLKGVKYIGYEQEREYNQLSSRGHNQLSFRVRISPKKQEISPEIGRYLSLALGILTWFLESVFGIS